MKPNHIILLAEQYNDDVLRLSYDRFFQGPSSDFEFQDTIKVPEHFERQNDMPFMEKRLRNTIGRFVDKINAAMDRNNQITVHMPEIWGRKVTIYADNILTLTRTRSYIAEILEAYSLDELPRLQAIGFIDEKVRESKKPRESFNRQAASAKTLIDPETLIAHYLNGVNIDYLAEPGKEPVYDSFKLDMGFKKVDMSRLDFYFGDNRAPEFVGEKENAESQRAFDEHWNIRFFEGDKAKAYQNLKAFLQSNLSVSVSISDFSSSTIELRGRRDDVALAKKIGVRAVPLINAEKVLDQAWLENALADAKIKTSIKNICEAQGTLYSEEEARKAQRKAKLKGFNDIAPAVG